MENHKMHPQEFKEFVKDIALKIAPTLVEKKTNSDDASTAIAIYAYHIADAVNTILINPTTTKL